MDIQSLVAFSKGQNDVFKNEDTIDRNLQENTSNTNEEFSTFLTLLTAQIRNQDPLAPLDSTQFVEQLATFSNLELQAEGNAVLEDIAYMLAQSLYANSATPQAPSEQDNRQSNPS